MILHVVGPRWGRLSFSCGFGAVDRSMRGRELSCVCFPFSRIDDCSGLDRALGRI